MCGFHIWARCRDPNSAYQGERMRMRGNLGFSLVMQALWRRDNGSEPRVQFEKAQFIFARIS
jgi:hypothetical protein